MTARPRYSHPWTVLHKGEFRDAFLRCGWEPPNLPITCGCGAQFNVAHAMQCMLGELEASFSHAWSIAIFSSRGPGTNIANLCVVGGLCLILLGFPDGVLGFVHLLRVQLLGPRSKEAGAVSSSDPLNCFSRWVHGFAMPSPANLAGRLNSSRSMSLT